jgi:pyruvate dehydrogenase E1 component beta subunit
MPATAYDAKGLLLESILGENPTVVIEHRSLFGMTDHVPEVPYRVRFGKGMVRCPGADVTLVALGAMVPLALRVAEQLARESIRAEVIDPRTVSPLDEDLLCESAARTRRLVVADPGWRAAGAAAEVMSVVAERVGARLAAPPARVCLPDSHTPSGAALEEQYYPSDDTVLAVVRRVMRGEGCRTAAA